MRDRLLGKPNKDVDSEPTTLFQRKWIVSWTHWVSEIAVGESFGIYNLKIFSIDATMRRKEKARGTGHRDFDVVVDQFAGTYSAACSCDFTINAFV